MVPTIALAAFNINLRYGSKGEEVKELQEFLTAQGVYNGPITGNFYSLTLKGVKDFQAKEAITPKSGFFGPISRTRANEILEVELQESNEEASTTPIHTPSAPEPIKVEIVNQPQTQTPMPEPTPEPAPSPEPQPASAPQPSIGTPTIAWEGVSAKLKTVQFKASTTAINPNFTPGQNTSPRAHCILPDGSVAYVGAEMNAQSELKAEVNENHGIGTFKCKFVSEGIEGKGVESPTIEFEIK